MKIQKMPENGKNTINKRDFEKEYSHADTIIKFNDEDMLKDFLIKRIKVDDFAQNNFRNNPLLQKEVMELEKRIERHGISSYHLSFIVHADKVAAGLLSEQAKSKNDLILQLDYNQLNAYDTWNVTLLDGHHRRQALLDRMEHKKILKDDFPIVVRVRFMRTPRHPWELRE